VRFLMSPSRSARPPSAAASPGIATTTTTTKRIGISWPSVEIAAVAVAWGVTSRKAMNERSTASRAD
jgi:hypothetical protein